MSIMLKQCVINPIIAMSLLVGCNPTEIPPVASYGQQNAGHNGACETCGTVDPLALGQFSLGTEY